MSARDDTAHTPQQIGTDAEQSVHRDPAPSVAEHNAAVQQARTDGTLPRHW
jgi:hypothetical protein